jgi:hypothetical protein
MAGSPEHFVTTLIFPNEYIRNLNQVSGLTTRHIIYLKRKFLSGAGYELVHYPLEDCTGIDYRDERPLAIMVLGGLLLALLAFVGYMVYTYWDSLPSQTKIPIGLLALAAVYGFRSVLTARRHRLTFKMKDGTRLIWKSRSGDYKYKEGGAAKVVELAKARGLLAGPG